MIKTKHCLGPNPNLVIDESEKPMANVDFYVNCTQSLYYYKKTDEKKQNFEHFTIIKCGDTKEGVHEIEPGECARIKSEDELIITAAEQGLDENYFLGWVKGYTRSNKGDMEKCHILELHWFPDVETLDQLAQTLAPK